MHAFAMSSCSLFCSSLPPIWPYTLLLSTSAFRIAKTSLALPHNLLTSRLTSHTCRKLLKLPCKCVQEQHHCLRHDLYVPDKGLHCTPVLSCAALSSLGDAHVDFFPAFLLVPGPWSFHLDNAYVDCPASLAVPNFCQLSPVHAAHLMNRSSTLHARTRAQPIPIFCPSCLMRSEGPEQLRPLRVLHGFERGLPCRCLF